MGNCKDCKHWDRSYTDVDKQTCLILALSPDGNVWDLAITESGSLLPDGWQTIATPANFGCNQFEQRES